MLDRTVLRSKPGSCVPTSLPTSVCARWWGFWAAPVVCSHYLISKGHVFIQDWLGRCWSSIYVHCTCRNPSRGVEGSWKSLLLLTWKMTLQQFKCLGEHRVTYRDLESFPQGTLEPLENRRTPGLGRKWSPTRHPVVSGSRDAPVSTVSQEPRSHPGGPCGTVWILGRVTAAHKDWNALVCLSLWTQQDIF